MFAKKFSDNDLGLPKLEMVKPRRRYFVRGIAYDDDYYALSLYNKNENIYILPGKEISENSDREMEFKKMMKAHFNLVIDQIEEIGKTVEERTRDDEIIISYILCGHSEGEMPQVSLKKKTSKKFKACWLNSIYLIKYMRNNIKVYYGDFTTKNYETKFNYLRDIRTVIGFAIHFCCD